MSDLLKDINTLLGEAIASERNTFNIYVKLMEAYEGLGNEKFEDVSGLHRPNFVTYMTYIKAHLGELESIKFPVEMRIADKDRKDSEIIMSKWNEALKKIPRKDESSLEGIESWYISGYEMVPENEKIRSPLFREEARKLVASGFNIAFNSDHGTGSIHKTEEGFVIELWRNMKKTVICKNTLDEVLDWIAYFYDQE